MLKKLYKILSIVLIILMISFPLYSQAENKKDSVKVQLIARAYKDKVILRWAPTTALAWQLANKYGYTIEKVAMTKKNKLIKDRAVIKLVDQPIKVWPEDKWEGIVKDSTGNIDKYGVIAAQAIFGGSFDLSESFTGNYLKAIEKAEENDRRFTFALFAADQSLKVADAMGLMFVDHNVVPDEKYLYRVYANVPASIMQIDTGFVFTGSQDFKQLPRPIDFSGVFEDQIVNLSWNRELFESVYTDYIVQRSDNGKDFLPIGDLPFINTTPDNIKNPRMMYRMDSLPDNNKTYYYRIRGRTPFNEFSPWSDTISGQSISKMVICPSIISTDIIENKAVNIKWEFPIDKNKEISFFSVFRSDKANGQFSPIVQNINPDKREFIDNAPLPGNYYIVRVFNKSGKSNASYPAFAQLVDSFPPSRPLMPKVSADTSGIVTLSWKKVPENDATGYRIFRSNFRDSEFGQITSSPISDTIFKEKIALDNIEPFIYYKIAAIDYNFNQSELSPAVMLEKPDTMAPVPPIFKKANSTAKGSVLEWINSPSSDVVYNQLQRRKKNNQNWEKIAQFEIRDSLYQYIDTIAIAGLEMEYAIIAIDKSGNHSMISKTVYAKKIDNGIRPILSDIETKIDRSKKNIEISWKYPYNNIESFLIYKGEVKNNISFYKTIKGNSYSFIDEDITINKTYIYRIKVRFFDGSETKLSNEIDVKF